MRKQREKYEFSAQVKLEALRKSEYKCRDCGKSSKETKLYAHHLLPIGVAVNHYPHILPELIKSVDNCYVVCDDCHKKEDQESFQNHRTIALALLFIQRLQQAQAS